MYRVIWSINGHQWTDLHDYATYEAARFHGAAFSQLTNNTVTYEVVTVIA